MPRYNRFWTEVNVLIRDQFSFQTWLLTGALLQSVLLHYFPPKYALAPAISYAVYTSTTYLLESLNILSTSTQPPSPIGRFTAHPPQDRPVTVFLLGFQSSHPLRIMAWGTKTIGDHFNEIFAEAEGNPESGLLGRCGPLLDAGGEGGNAMFTISYWRSKEELVAFNKGVAHSKGMKWYYATKAKYPYLGEWVRTVSKTNLGHPFDRLILRLFISYNPTKSSHPSRIIRSIILSSL